MIAQRRRRGARRISFGGGSDSEQRSDDFFAEGEAQRQAQIEQANLDEQQRKDSEKQARDTSLLQAEEARRQEAHELDVQGKEQAMQQQGETFERQGKVADRSEAYEMVKQGLMMRDSQTVNAALQQLAPQGEDVITEGEPVDGARSFKGRPAQAEVPQFVFDPDTEYVGVTFPGQEKPTVFKNAEAAFQNVLAPMNPKHEKSKDQVAENKSVREAKFKEKKLSAETHFNAHEAAMEQFNADGYFQPALYDKAKYDAIYADHISRATGQAAEDVKVPPVTAKDKKARSIPKNIYRGKGPPKGHPNARRGKDGGWYVKKGDGWEAVIDDKKKKKAPAPKEEMSNAGINFRGSGKTVIRRKMPGMVAAPRG
jgi:hypothetical protein